jgi:HAAS domain-containing protein
MSAVERYLRELRGRLPLAVRSRVLAEAEDHLRESARELGEEEAVAGFGPAAALADAYRVRVGWIYAALGLLAALAYPILSYPLPENSLPPAAWPNVDEMPRELAWKREWIVVLFVFSLVAGAVALGAIGLAGILGTLLSWEWRNYVPGTPDGLLVLGPLQIAVALAGLALLARAAALSRA